MARRAGSPEKFAYDPSMRIVVLHGDDGFQIRERTKEIAEALRKHFGEIEEFTYDGEAAQLADVLDELRSYGLIQRHKLVILDNVDEFLKEPKDGEDDGDESMPRSSYRPAMERYAASPVDHATLLMRARTWRGGKLEKAVAKVGMVCKMEAPTAARATSWAVSRCRKRYESEIESAAAELLVSQIGPDLARLDIELAKLAAFAGSQGSNTITRAMVGELVGLSREEKVWSLQLPIASGEPGWALEKLREMFEVSRQHEVLVSWAIMDLMRKIHAASHLLARGTRPFDAVKQLKLWGDSQEAILAGARRVSPAVSARLLDRAVRTDQHNKSGVGEPQRSLEALTLEIADTIKRGR